jgi:hypothetical protein
MIAELGLVLISGFVSTRGVTSAGNTGSPQLCINARPYICGKYQIAAAWYQCTALHLRETPARRRFVSGHDSSLADKR